MPKLGENGASPSPRENLADEAKERRNMDTNLLVGLLLGVIIAFPLGALFSARYKIVKRDDKIKVVEREK